MIITEKEKLKLKEIIDDIAYGDYDLRQTGIAKLKTALTFAEVNK